MEHIFLNFLCSKKTQKKDTAVHSMLYGRIQQHNTTQMGLLPLWPRSRPQLCNPLKVGVFDDLRPQFCENVLHCFEYIYKRGDSPLCSGFFSL